MSPFTSQLETRTRQPAEALQMRFLTYDRPNRRHLLRVSLDLGTTQKRLTIALATEDPAEAIRQREAVLATLAALGLQVKSRSFIGKGGRP